jgi:hypothetical protein
MSETIKTDTLIEIRCRLRLKSSTIERIKRIALKERRRINGVMERAVEEISDRGHTDDVVIKGKI